jgi:hypothetical protein
VAKSRLTKSNKKRKIDEITHSDEVEDSLSEPSESDHERNQEVIGRKETGHAKKLKTTEAAEEGYRLNNEPSPPPLETSASQAKRAVPAFLKRQPAVIGQ